MNNSTTEREVSTRYYTQDQIDRANQADLVSFLQSQGEPLKRAGQEFRWKRHDSLTVRDNKWYRHSQSKGGGPVDFVMEFFGKSFTEAVELLTGEKGAAAPPDRPCPASLSDFRLPPPNSDNQTARNYLTAARRIDEDVTGFFFARGDIYEDAAHHNAVFVGRDEDEIPRYAHSKGTAGNFRLDVKGSDKAFNFCYRGEGERLFVFEAPVDLLSFLCLFKKDWQKQSYLSLGGVGEKALLRFLSDRPNIKTVYLCLDSDQAGNDACSRLAELVPEGYTVHRLVPLYALNMAEESDGTNSYFKLIGVVKKALDQGTLLVADEMDAHLHPLLTRHLVSLFDSTEFNPKGAQLIFTSHSTNLLDLDLLRRDQIWFTEKDEQTAATDLFSLYDFSVRKDTKVEKGYLIGRFGAIPFIKGGL